MSRARIRTDAVQHWVVVICLLLVLIFTGLETTHAHPAGDAARGSTPCAVCIAVHANAPALTAYFLPILFVVEAVTGSFRAQHTGTTADLWLFIRPPPAG
jgi:hypothetical protein